MTFEEAENAHNDINQWQATRDFRIHSPSMLKSPLMDIEQHKEGPREAHQSSCISAYLSVLTECIMGMINSQGSCVCKYFYHS